MPRWLLALAIVVAPAVAAAEGDLPHYYPRATVGPGIDPGMLSTMFAHGQTHVTYGGWTLFYYHRDRVPGDTTGQAVFDRWGYWYLLSPSGEPIRPAGGY